LKNLKGYLGTGSILNMEITNPVKMDELTVQKIEEALAMDCTIDEVCLYADISKQTYYNWVASFPDLKERFDLLRKNPILKARQVVIDKLGESYQNAMDYLKRKQKKEFGDNVDITSGNKPIPILQNVRGDNSDKKNNGDEAKDTDSPGRDIGLEDSEHNLDFDSSGTIG